MVAEELPVHFVNQLFSTLSGAFTLLSGMNWSPPVGWSFTGGDYTVAVPTVAECSPRRQRSTSTSSSKRSSALVEGPARARPPRFGIVERPGLHRS